LNNVLPLLGFDAPVAPREPEPDRWNDEARGWTRDGKSAAIAAIWFWMEFRFHLAVETARAQMGYAGRSGANCETLANSTRPRSRLLDPAAREHGAT
jgi:hypothetical protein